MFVSSRFVVASFLIAMSSALLAQNSPKWRLIDQPTPDASTFVPLRPMRSSAPLSISLCLPFADPVGMQKFVDSVSNPKSPNYRQFITPEEVGRRFGQSMATVQRLSNYLTSSGLTIKFVAKSRLTLSATGTVSQIETAFHTKLQEFSVTVHGIPSAETRFANIIPPSLPPNLARSVSFIAGLQSLAQPRPQSPLTPDQIRTLYSAAQTYSNGFQGQGRTVAITNFDGYRLSNISLEYNQFNLPSPPGGVGTNIQIVPIDNEDGNTSTAQGEGDIDIQTVLAIVPLCNLIIYDDANDPSDNGPILTLTKESEDNLADVVSESYGYPTALSSIYAAVHNLHLTMSAQGITYLCASGDTGTASLISAPYPDIDPEILTVGGTTVVTDGNGDRQSEVVWNNTYGSGGGGWVPTSQAFNVLPSWQKGTGVPTSIPYRLVPDVSLDADPVTGYQIFIEGMGIQQYGGTSCASPTTAGALAACEQAIIAGGGLPANAKGKQRFGRIQDLLYSLNGNPTVFYDIISGTNGSLPDGSDSNAVAGWDTASGWGTPIFSGLINFVLGIPVPSGLALNPSAIVGGVGIQATIWLTIPAPKGGLTLTVASDTGGVTVPATVVVPAGSASATFSITTSPVLESETATISATGNQISALATLTVNPAGLSGISISPNPIVGGNFSLGTVTLFGPAPSGGLTVALSASSNIVTMPLNVTVDEGSSTGSFSINTGAVTSPTSVVITGTANGISQSATLSISTVGLSSISLSPASVPGGVTSVATITLSGPAPTAGVVVALKSSNANANIASNVTVPSGSSTATVSVSTSRVNAQTIATITASEGGFSLSTDLTIVPVGLQSVTASPTTVVGGNSTIGTVTMSGPAPSGGLTVSLIASDSNVSVPTTISIPAGSSSATFTVSTVPVASTDSPSISATYGGQTKSVGFVISPPTLSVLSVAPASITGGATATGTLTLTGKAAAPGITISLSASGNSVSLPTSVTVPAGAASVNFGITSSAVTTTTAVTISAQQGSNQQSTTLTINPPMLSSLSLTPSTVVGGGTSTGTITLTSVAPKGGLSVNLTSTSSHASVPATVIVSAGSLSATFNLATTTVSTTETDTITATLGGVSQTQNLTVQSPLLSAVSVSPTSVIGGNVATGTVSLSRPAPSGGTVVSLASNLNAVYVPTSVTIAAGAQSGTFSASTSGLSASTTATITATLAGISHSATLTVAPATLLSLTLTPSSVSEGVSVTGSVKLNGFAPTGGTTINLTSNSSVATTLSQVTVPAGSNVVDVTILTKTVSKSTSVTITASAGGITQPAVLNVLPPTVASLSVSQSEFVGGSKVTVTGIVSLTGPAPTAGLTVNLKSSDPKAVSVPASIHIPSGSQTAKITLIHHLVSSPESVTISATQSGVTVSAQLTLDPFEVTSLSIAPTLIPGGTTAAGVVELNAIPGSGSGPVPVHLTSDSTSATVPANVSVTIGDQTAKFNLTSKPVSSSTLTLIKATYGPTSQSAGITISPASLLSFTISPTSVKGSASTLVTGTLKLSSPAPTSGAMIIVSSSDPSAAFAPLTVKVPAGASSVTVSVTHKRVSSSTPVTLTATFGGNQLKALLTVNP